MQAISQRISSILEKRHQQLNVVRNEMERLRRIEAALSGLETAVAELKISPSIAIELKEEMGNFQTQELHRGIAEALELFRILEARISRGTINIGVSGRARVGKSTLLQAISGLKDEQIPTGKALPVTAVRSRIFHSSSRQRATLTFHGFDTFLQEVLLPYHQELGLLGVPANKEEFRHWSYPTAEHELPSEARNKHSSVTMLRRLREMQQALWSYETDLSAGERVLDLAAIRQYIAYPTHEETQLAEKCPRKYLAVREARIDCTFPYAQVEHLGLIDLPGLGELAANAEATHLGGLRNEVDLVLLVKRPLEGMAYWGKEDGNAADLLDHARGFIQSRRDFVFILINNGGVDPKLTSALQTHIHQQVNDNKPDEHFRVLVADAADPQAVHELVIAPLLEHLVERLPVMDEQVFEGTRNQCTTLMSRLRIAISDLEQLLSRIGGSAGSSAEDLEERTSELRKDLAAALTELVDDLRARARAEEEDPEYMAAINASNEDVRKWLRSGFEIGKEAWCENALRTMRVDRSSSPFAATELNRIRVEISRHYGSMDDFFRSRVEWLWEQVANILSRNLGGLLKGRMGREALLCFAERLSEAAEPCPTLSGAVRDLLELRLDYRTHLHPRVRRELDSLNLQIRSNDSREARNQIVVDVSKAGAEELYRSITKLAEQASYMTRKALIAEGVMPALVLHAAAEQFEDTLIRSGDSVREFKRLTRSYRDELWPGLYKGIDESSARFARVVKALRSIRNELSGV